MNRPTATSLMISRRSPASEGGAPSLESPSASCVQQKATRTCEGLASTGAKVDASPEQASAPHQLVPTLHDLVGGAAAPMEQPRVWLSGALEHLRSLLESGHGRARAGETEARRGGGRKEAMAYFLRKPGFATWYSFLIVMPSIMLFTRIHASDPGSIGDL